MAKSIYDILNDLETETSVPDFGILKHTLPRELLPTAEQFEDSEQLLEWAKDNDCIHSALQKGIQKFIIDLRATFKAVKKDEKWDIEKGQKAVNNAKWTITKRPNVNDKETIKRQAIFDANMNMAKALNDTEGVTEEMILTTLTASCGAELAKEIIDKLE